MILTTRRRWMAGLGAGATALPWLQPFARAADDGPVPKLVIVAGPNGPFVGPDGGSAGGGYAGWRPEGFAGLEMPLPATLPHVFEPLAAHRDRLVFLEGLTVPGAGDAHHDCAALLTGRPSYVPPGVDPLSYTSSGISVDNHIADVIGSRVLSLAFNISGYQVGESYFSYLGPEQAVTPIMDPIAAFELVFGDGTTGAAAAALLARRTSILDQSLADMQRMRARISASDRARLDAHAEAIRTLEQQLGDNQACAAPSSPQTYPPLEFASYPAVIRDHTDILVQALACGWTRIGTLQLGNLEGSVFPQWPELGLESSYKYHAISHAFVGVDGAGSDGLSRDDAIALGIEFERLFSSQLAYLLDRLANTPDVDGSPMLDHTMVLFLREHGQNHDDRFLLWTLAGGPGVGVAGGRFLPVGDGAGDVRYLNDLMTSICHGMGVDSDGFGDTQYCREPIALG